MVRIRASWAVVAVLGLVVLVGGPGPAHAEWPPFSLKLTSQLAANQISYYLRLSGAKEWSPMDVAIKVPLPAGTRLVEAKSDHPGVEVSFDGKEVSFLAAVVHGSLQDLHITVEIIDPQVTVFTTRAYVVWKGDPPGTYLGRDVTIDLSKPMLTWTGPFSFLNLEFYAVSEGDTVTYSMRPTNTGWLRMWDLKIELPVPEGTAVVGTEAPPGFVGGSDGRIVSFSTLELPQAAWYNPLRFKISTVGLAQSVVSTRALAIWKNDGWGVPDRYPPQDQLESGYLVVYPHADQLVVAGLVGDVPFDYYDVTSVAFMPQQSDLLVVFYTMGDVTTSGDTVEFDLFIDSDCRADTGDAVSDTRGADFRAVYDNQYQDAGVELWDSNTKEWNRIASIKGSSPTGAHTISMWIPYQLLPGGTGLCWAADAIPWNRKGYKPYPPGDEILNGDDTRLPLPEWHTPWGSGATR